MPAEVVAQFRAGVAQRNASETFGVWPENWHAVLAFCDMSDQWSLVATMGGVYWQGLNYASLPVVLQALKPTVGRRYRKPLHELLPQLRALAQAAAAIKNAA